MTEKRFTINDCRVLSDEQLLKILNQLYDENQKVFDSMDNRLRYYQELLGNEKRNGWNFLLLQRIVDDLKDLKRIKKGDD